MPTCKNDEMEHKELPCDTLRKELERCKITEAARGESLNHSIKRENALRKELDEVVIQRDNFFSDANKCLDKLLDCKAERDRYINTFKHYHVAGRDGNIDKCHKCGLDLRDPIHRRNDG